MADHHVEHGGAVLEGLRDDRSPARTGAGAPRTARSADSGTAHGQIAVQEIFLRRYGIARSACADAGLDGAGVGSPMQASSHRPLTRAERRAAADRTCVHTTSRPHAAPSNTTDPCLRSGGEVADRRGIPSPGRRDVWLDTFPWRRGVRLGARSREQPGRAFVSLWHPTLRGSVQGVRGCIIKPMASPFAPRGERFQRRAPQASPAASDPRARVSSAPIEAGCEMSALGTERRLRCSAQARWARTWPAADSSACTPDSPALAQPNQSRLRGAAHTTSRPHGRTTLAHRQSLARASLFATSSPARRRASRAPATARLPRTPNPAPAARLRSACSVQLMRRVPFSRCSLARPSCTPSLTAPQHQRRRAKVRLSL